VIADGDARLNGLKMRVARDDALAMLDPDLAAAEEVEHLRCVRLARRDSGVGLRQLL
jgi:hypothetical protein